MSKKLKPPSSATKDPNWPRGMYVTGNYIDPEDSALVTLMFDQVTDEDEKEIELTKKQTLLLRKVCWVKILSYPVELTLTWLFLGKGWSGERAEQHAVYREFLKGEMPIEKFNNRLLALGDKYLKAKSE